MLSSLLNTQSNSYYDNFVILSLKILCCVVQLINIAHTIAAQNRDL